MKKSSSPARDKREIFSLASCRRGGMGVLGAVLTVVVVAAVGLGVDLTRMMLVKSRLQTSVDAAALVAGREMNLPVNVAETDAKALFWSNFGRTGASTDPNNKDYKGYLGAVAGDPTFTRPSGDVNTVTVNATATVEMTLMAIVGAKTTTVPAQASAKRAVLGMELALVLDVTGSMGPNVDSDNGPTNTGSNIAAQRAAATNLVNILFGSNDTQPNLFVSVVQFVASVNIGTQNTQWLKELPDSRKYGNAGWAGCVEARSDGEDQTDTPPIGDARFTPFLWQSTMDKYKYKSEDKNKSEDTVVTGDNDWYYLYDGPNKSLTGQTKITEQQQPTMADGNKAVGPNLSCPFVPILPLTASKAAVQASIDRVVATNRGGTTGNLGLQAGWWTLSPRWTGLWGGTPTVGLPNGAVSLPLPYNALNMQKVVIYMTDGNNLWYDWPGGAPGDGPAYNDSKPDADYTAYGWLSENRLKVKPVSIDSAKIELDKRTAALCTSMKTAGVTIYTIIFSHGGYIDYATQALWKGCASKPENYFNTPSQADLAVAFQQIGTQLASLRLTF